MTAAFGVWNPPVRHGCSGVMGKLGNCPLPPCPSVARLCGVITHFIFVIADRPILADTYRNTSTRGREEE